MLKYLKHSVKYFNIVYCPSNMPGERQHMVVQEKNFNFLITDLVNQ